jgi:solute carrier family 8 (sodium/calcium exchanger)
LITAIVTISEDHHLKHKANKVVSTLGINMDRFNLGASNWKDQFSDAVTIPKGSIITRVIAVLTVPWKLIFAFVPPTTYLSGTLTFFFSLGMITLVTILIGDFASLFGCGLGLKDAITAITFVALGTSLPDTFASTSAAIGDATADNCIGNVTGSNSVNVFLGLGLPWLIASIYWSYQGATPEWVARVLLFSALLPFSRLTFILSPPHSLALSLSRSPTLSFFVPPAFLDSETTSKAQLRACSPSSPLPVPCGGAPLP